MNTQQNPDDKLLQELSAVRLQMSAMKRKVTQQTKSLETLKEEKERLSVTLRSISEGVITTDMNGRVIFVNAAAERLIDCSKEEAVGRLISGVIHVTHEEGGEKNLGALLDTALETRRVIEMAAASTVVSSDGKTRLFPSPSPLSMIATICFGSRPCSP